MRRRVFLLIFAAVVLANGLFIVHVRRERAARKDAAPAGLAADTAKRDEALGKRRAKAADFVERWNADHSVPIASDELPAAVAGISSVDCLSAPHGTSRRARPELSAEQSADLNAAIVGLLRAYATNEPETVIQFMHDRGEVIDHDVRGVLESALRKQGQSEFDTLNDEQLFARLWAAIGCRSHWDGLLADSSCLQLWEGTGLPRAAVGRFDASETKDPDAPAVELFTSFGGMSKRMHHFRPLQGSLDDQLAGAGPVLFADIRLIIECDDAWMRSKSPVLCRFWYNATSATWQPLALSVFPGDPQQRAFPMFLF
jgi:hypothetical protein